MRTLFFLAALLSASPVFAQEGSSTEEPEVPVVTTTTLDMPLVERAIERYAERFGHAYRTGRMQMSGGQVCLYRDFPIPRDTPHLHAGLVLRVLVGVCVRDVYYYVHDPVRRRIWLISEQEAATILAVLTDSGVTTSASE